MSDLSQIRVCFIAGTLGRGGAERQLVYMLHALSRAGVQTRVLCLTHGEPFEREIRALGVPVEWVGASGSRLVRLYRIIRSLHREPADILQSVHFYTNLYAAIAARIVGARDIGAIRSNLTYEMETNGTLGWGQLHLPHHLIVNSSLARQRAIEHGISPNRIELVRNAVVMRGTNGKGSTHESDEVRVLFAGRLTAEKRPDRFLRVLSRVVKHLPKQKLRIKIAGDGPLRPHVEDLTGTLGLGSDRVEFLGEVEDMSSAYRETDLLMLTSDREGTPNVLLEAMAHSIPVAATRVGGVPEIVSNDRGFLADPGDEDALTAAAMQLVSDSSLRSKLGKSGYEYVARFHSLDALQVQLTDIYRKLSSQ